MKTFQLLMVLTIGVLLFPPRINGQAALDSLADDARFRTPQNVVTELYKLVTFESGKMPDWEEVKSLFIEEAVIVLRLGPATMRTFNRQSFVDYFIYDIKRSNLLESGFTENIIKTQMEVIKDIAHCFVLYEVSVPGRFDNKPVNRGIDSIHLIKKNDHWLIASIINEGFRMSDPLPDMFVKK
jgi:hypothetical protein